VTGGRRPRSARIAWASHTVTFNVSGSVLLPKLAGTTSTTFNERARRARKQTRSLLAHVATQLRKRQPKHITDPTVGAALAAADAEALQAALTL
jgi:hypothetical protein